MHGNESVNNDQQCHPFLLLYQSRSKKATVKLYQFTEWGGGRVGAGGGVGVGVGGRGVVWFWFRVSP